MTERGHFILAHQLARQRAAKCVAEAPAGWVVDVRPPKRNSEQNALLWVLMDAFSRQLEWPVNGRMVKLDAAEWKDILTASFKRETQRMSPSLDGGGVVLLGLRTSRMSKSQFSEFIEFIKFVASDRGVDLHDEQCTTE